MKEPCEKCKALFQMRIGELEKRMDYKFEQRTRRVELLKGSSVNLLSPISIHSELPI